ncbi:hypothetical protein H2248_006867 [Termitomyces sp. 'cryptogamus']|nr:hypothetical protein H2248_006867 [Termitomyces sp. 'cryptogamus']
MPIAAHSTEVALPATTSQAITLPQSMLVELLPSSPPATTTPQPQLPPAVLQSMQSSITSNVATVTASDSCPWPTSSPLGPIREHASIAASNSSSLGISMSPQQEWSELLARLAKKPDANVPAKTSCEECYHKESYAACSKSNDSLQPTCQKDSK